jgi:predicted O-methyltransferase YrrM
MARDASIFAIDPFPSGRLGFSIQSVIAHREVSKVHNGQVVWMRQKGAQTAGTLRGTEPFDFVFIDGDHSYEGLAEDWTAWSPLCGEGGIIALHDSRSTSYRPLDGAGSVRYTRDVILRDRRFELLEEVDSLTVMRRVRD